MRNNQSFLIITITIALFLVGCNANDFQNNQKTYDLPEGYTLEKFLVEEISDISCESDSDCETPIKYLAMSRCPFTSKCLNNKCAVICPNHISAQICPKNSESQIVEVDETEIHCLSWLDSDLNQLLKEANLFNTSDDIHDPSYSLIINNTKCNDKKLENKFVSQGEASGFCGKLENAWDSSFENCGTFQFRIIISGSKKQTCLVLNNEMIYSYPETSNCTWL